MTKPKRALLIGINYRGTSSELNGCINDVNNVKEFLLKKGYKEKNITMLIDDTEIKPTRANVISCFLDLILSESKTLYFHYSGHGGSVRDVSGDEVDGRDETLCPLDYATCGQIVDDEIRALLTFLRSEQSLTAVIDACHSQTSCDLRWNLYERFGGRKLALVADNHYSDTRGQVVMVSGCLDPQTSADAYIAGEYQGALTNSFLESYSKSKTYEQLIKNIRSLLRKGKFSQIPSLASGKQFDLQTKLSV